MHIFIAKIKIHVCQKDTIPKCRLETFFKSGILDDTGIYKPNALPFESKRAVILNNLILKIMFQNI